MGILDTFSTHLFESQSFISEIALRGLSTRIAIKPAIIPTVLISPIVTTILAPVFDELKNGSDGNAMT